MSNARSSSVNTGLIPKQVSSTVQKIAGALASILTLTAVFMTVVWAHGSDDDDELFLGGINFKRQLFNWHPILMISGLIFFFVNSLLSYRLLPYKKKVSKLIHALLHTCAIVCIGLGMAAVITSKTQTNKNVDGQYQPSFYSLHSLVGLITICCYSLNFIGGLVAFLTKLVPMRIKAKMRPYHMFFGTIVLFEATAAVMSGIVELSRLNGCKNIVDSASWNPAEDYHELERGCQLANGIGIIVLASVFCCAYALFGPRSTKLISVDLVDDAEYL